MQALTDKILEKPDDEKVQADDVWTKIAQNESRLKLYKWAKDLIEQHQETRSHRIATQQLKASGRRRASWRGPRAG